MNDKFLLSVYGCVSIGDLYTGKIEKVWKINGKEIYCKEIIDDKYAVFIQIDTSCFNFYLMNIQTGDVIKTFEIPDNNGKWLSINNSYYYVSINTDGTMLEVWDIFSEERVGQFISEQRMEIENITINGIALGDAETKKTILQLENLLSTPKIDKPSQNAQKSPIKQGNIEELLKNLGIDSNKKPKPSGFFTRLFGRK
jgi:hypothetical protein